MILLSEVLEEKRTEHMVLGGILIFPWLTDQIPGQKQDVCMSSQCQWTKVRFTVYFYHFNLK